MRTLAKTAETSLEDYDIRAEVLIAHLLENTAFHLEQFLVHPLGTFHRSYKKDVLSLEINGEETQRTKVVVNVAREGLYDMLPEGLFHATPPTKKIASTQEVIEESGRYRKEEKASRNFFLPLEQEFYGHRIQLELTERLFWNALSQHDPFANFWQIKQRDLPTHQLSVLLALLPFAHQIAGNLSLTARALEILLGETVAVTLIAPEPITPEHQADWVLNDSVVGINFILGEEWSDDNPSVAVSIGPVKAKDLLRVMPEGEAQKVLDTLFGFLMPAEATVVTQVKVEEEESIFILSDDTFTGRLRYTTTLA